MQGLGLIPSTKEKDGRRKEGRRKGREAWKGRRRRKRVIGGGKDGDDWQVSHLFNPQEAWRSSTKGTHDWYRFNFHSWVGKTIKWPMFSRQEPYQGVALPWAYTEGRTSGFKLQETILHLYQQLYQPLSRKKKKQKPTTITKNLSACLSESKKHIESALTAFQLVYIYLSNLSG